MRHKQKSDIDVREVEVVEITPSEPIPPADQPAPADSDVVQCTMPLYSIALAFEDATVNGIAQEDIVIVPCNGGYRWVAPAGIAERYAENAGWGAPVNFIEYLGLDA